MVTGSRAGSNGDQITGEVPWGTGVTGYGELYQTRGVGDGPDRPEGQQDLDPIGNKGCWRWLRILVAGCGRTHHDAQRVVCFARRKLLDGEPGTSLGISIASGLGATARPKSPDAHADVAQRLAQVIKDPTFEDCATAPGRIHRCRRGMRGPAPARCQPAAWSGIPARSVFERVRSSVLSHDGCRVCPPASSVTGSHDGRRKSGSVPARPKASVSSQYTGIRRMPSRRPFGVKPDAGDQGREQQVDGKRGGYGGWQTCLPWCPTAWSRAAGSRFRTDTRMTNQLDAM